MTAQCAAWASAGAAAASLIKFSATSIQPDSCTRPTKPVMLQDAAPLVMVQCEAWAGAAQQPQQASLVEFFPASIQPDSCTGTHALPSLHAAFLPAWHLLLTAHGLASDEHVKLVGELVC